METSARESGEAKESSMGKHGGKPEAQGQTPQQKADSFDAQFEASRQGGQAKAERGEGAWALDKALADLRSGKALEPKNDRRK